MESSNLDNTKETNGEMKPPPSLPCKKLRPLIITMGGPRKAHIETMFTTPPLSSYFHPPQFSPGISVRALRSRKGLLTTANEAGLLPPLEWEALSQSFARGDEDPFKSLEGVLIEDRRGSEWDKSVHYSVELWRKCKSLSRDRAILGCTLAHLIAMKEFVQNPDLDLILEDNIRPINGSECFDRVTQTIEEAEAIAADFVYFGWLGSPHNVRWVLESHAAETRRGDLFPFPTNEHIKSGDVKGTTPIWGSYAYAVTRKGHEAILSQLRVDVGGLAWRGKRMRAYKAKPADKVLPRRLIDGGGTVWVTTRPAFFRAPMLQSKIHTKWDAEFCKSTEVQLGLSNLTWGELKLTEAERNAVLWKEENDEWITPEEVEEKKKIRNNA